MRETGVEPARLAALEPKDVTALRHTEKLAGTALADVCESLSGPAAADLVQGGAPQMGTLERLSRTLEAAALAGQWDVVRHLAAALEGLKAPAGPDADVISLDSRRGKGGPR